jgi:hypothetical protein
MTLYVDVKLILEASKPLYQEVMSSIKVIADTYKKRQGDHFNADVTWEILFDYMNGEIELDACMNILSGDQKQGLHEHYKNMLEAEK